MSALDSRERDLVKCEDRRIHAERAVEYLGERTLEEFLDDHLIQAAVIRCVEVVGEGTLQTLTPIATLPEEQAASADYKDDPRPAA